MVVGIFGGNRAGESAIASDLARQRGAAVDTDKNFLRPGRNPNNAGRRLFRCFARARRGRAGSSAPRPGRSSSRCCPKAARAVRNGGPDMIMARFAARMGGSLPPPIAAMPERKRGLFGGAPHELLLKNGGQNPVEAAEAIAEAALTLRGG